MTKLWKVIATSLLSAVSSGAPQVSFTFDDPNHYPSPRLSALHRDKQLLKTLKAKRVKAALFVCGMRVDEATGREILERWNADGHLIGNHSYSHLNFNSPKTSFESYRDDLVKGESVLSSFAGFEKIFRFPFLKEGDTVAKRDRFRHFLAERGYRNGSVTIDASDWYIFQRIVDKLRTEPHADLAPYRKYYLEHLMDRAVYYRNLAVKVVGREVPHTLLLHHNLLNALFLADIVDKFREQGWDVIDAAEAFRDPVYRKEPKIAPAGESLIWALAKESGKFESSLRYPGESDEYEKPKMDKLGL